MLIYAIYLASQNHKLKRRETVILIRFKGKLIGLKLPEACSVVRYAILVHPKFQENNNNDNN